MIPERYKDCRSIETYFRNVYFFFRCCCCWRKRTLIHKCQWFMGVRMLIVLSNNRIPFSIVCCFLWFLSTLPVLWFFIVPFHPFLEWSIIYLAIEKKEPRTTTEDLISTIFNTHNMSNPIPWLLKVQKYATLILVVMFMIHLSWYQAFYRCL